MKILQTTGLVVVVILAGLFLLEVILLLQLKQNVISFKNYWTKKNEEKINPDKILYVALGDSAAQGLGASSPEKGYVGLIAEALERKAGMSVQTINLSVTGAKIQDLIDDQLPRLSDLPITEQTIVTLEIGANDMGAFDPLIFTQKIDTVLGLLPKQTIVADIPYFGGGRYQEHEDSAVKASEIIHSAGRKYGMVVAPLHDVTRERDSFLVNAADLFHPNNRGYRNWFEAFRKVMNL